MEEKLPRSSLGGPCIPMYAANLATPTRENLGGSYQQRPHVDIDRSREGGARASSFLR